MHSSVELGNPIPEAEKCLASDLYVIQPKLNRLAAARFRRGIVFLEVVMDLLTITCAVWLGYFMYNTLRIGKHAYYPSRAVFLVAAILAVVMVIMLDRAGAYRSGNSLLRVRETEQVLRVSVEAFCLVFAASFFSGFLFSRWLLLFIIGLVPLVLFLQKHLTYQLVRYLHIRGLGNEKVLIYGAGLTGRRVYSALRRSPRLGLDPVGFIDDDETKSGSEIHELGYDRRHCVRVMPGPVDRVSIVEMGIDLVIIAIPSIGRGRFVKVVEEVLGANARISFVPNHLLPSDPWLDYRDIDGVLLASFGKSSRRFGYEAVKRICDIAGSVCLLLAGLPVFMAVAIGTWIDSGRPVIFAQDRIGIGGKTFRMYKFRTMRSDTSGYAYSPKTHADPRITRLGRFLRRTSLDELPQLFNVLLGDMSLVGPRPEMPFIVAEYSERHRQRLQVKPGITGLWQLSGDRAFLIHENVEYDLYYIQHRNFFMDIAILLHTSVFAMRGV